MFGKSTQDRLKLDIIALHMGKIKPLCTFTLHFPQDFIILFGKGIEWPFQKVTQTSGENVW